LSTDEKQLKEFCDRIDYVDTMVSTASENGLFDGKKQNVIPYECILNKIKAARDSIEKSKPPDFSQCDHHLSIAADYYFKDVNSAPMSWRFLNIYAVHIWIYLIAFLCILFIFYYYNVNSTLLTKFAFLRNHSIAIDAVAWGIIGALLRGLWWLWKNVNRGQFRKAWIIWFISTPFLGGILGGIAYLLIFAGLIAVSQDKNITNSLFVMSIAALAGFNWEWIVEQLNRVKENL
jgi:hypothetical protein